MTRVRFAVAIDVLRAVDPDAAASVEDYVATLRDECARRRVTARYLRAQLDHSASHARSMPDALPDA